MKAIFFQVLALLIFNNFADAGTKEICIYQQNGKIIQVNSQADIPAEFKSYSKCFSKSSSDYLAQPEEVKLTGNVRREEMASSIGNIQLRWPRKVELLFGRTPQRAMADAASTASRALKAASFPVDLQTLDLDWKVVFMDEDLPETQIPTSLISNCHPAWMTPPANIYVVSQRVVAGCGGQKMNSKVADSELARILLREIGRAVEYRLLENRQNNDRMRAEGFASWFEQYSSDYSSIIPKGSMKKYYFKLAEESLRHQPVFYFSGSAQDYARASLFFHAIVERRGVRGLAEVYQTMVEDKLDFFPAVDKRMNWDEKKMQNEIERLFNS